MIDINFSKSSVKSALRSYLISISRFRRSHLHSELLNFNLDSEVLIYFESDFRDFVAFEFVDRSFSFCSSAYKPSDIIRLHQENKLCSHLISFKQFLDFLNIPISSFNGFSI